MRCLRVSEVENRKEEIRKNVKTRDDYDIFTDTYCIIHKLRVPMIITKEKIILYQDIMDKYNYQPTEREGERKRGDDNTLHADIFTLGTYYIMSSILKEYSKEKTIAEFNIHISEWIKKGEIKDKLMDYMDNDDEEMTVYGEKISYTSGCLWDKKVIVSD